MKTPLHIKNLVKRHGNQSIFQDFNLSIQNRAITVIFGPNGAGKSTFLNLIAGLLPCDEGEIGLGDRSEISYIFQNYREVLLPWFNIKENICLPLKFRGVKADEIEETFQGLIASLPIVLPWLHYPYQFSGGQQQVAVFLRGLISQPSLILADEPFSALDYENSLRMRAFLQAYFLKHKPTVVIVSHSLEEAVHLSHEVVLFSRSPVSVQAIIKNTLPFPRNHKVTKSNDFHKLKTKILDHFHTITHR